MTQSLNIQPALQTSQLPYSAVQQKANESYLRYAWRHFTSKCTVKNITKVTLAAGFAFASYLILRGQNSPKIVVEGASLTHNVATPAAIIDMFNTATAHALPSSQAASCPPLNQAPMETAAHTPFNPCDYVTALDERIACRLAKFAQQTTELKTLVANTLRDGGKIDNAAGNGQAGTSGIYFIKDKTGKTIALFKPEDEGTWRHNNPNPQYRKASLSEDDIFFHHVDSWEQGKSAERQLLAEMMHVGDKTLPPRGAIVELTSDLFFDLALNEKGIKGPLTKIGYLQEWVSNTKPFIRFHPSAKDIPPNELPPIEALNFHDNPILSAIPLDEFQEIGINDLLLLNEDRNTGNLLVRHDDNNLPHLIPIDNDSINPWILKKLQGIYAHKNADAPFTHNALKMIYGLDPDFIEQMVERMNLNEQAPINAKAAAMVLKRFVAAGATMRDIYNFLAVPQGAAIEETSELWKLIESSRESAIDSLSKDDKAMYVHYRYVRRTTWCKTVQQPWCQTLSPQEEKSAAEWYQYYQSKHATRIQSLIKTAFWKEFDKQLNQAVSEFSIRKTQNCEHIGTLKNVCWKRHDLAEGVAHYKFEGTYDSLKQRFELVKIDHTAKASLKVQNAKGVLKEGEKLVSGRLHLTDVAARVPNAIAAISGGNFHYIIPKGEFYEWNGPPFEEGDTIGETIVDGKVITENPPHKHWGALRINKQGHTTFVDTNTHPLAKTHNIHYSLGAVPLLVNNGVPITSEQLGPGLSLKPKQAPTPGIQFQSHIHMQHARAGVCQTKNKDHFLVMIEGRQQTAAGLRMAQFARMLKGLGCENALNLDGGGTADLVTKDADGKFVTTITPSDPKGKRPVATAIVVALNPEG